MGNNMFMCTERAMSYSDESRLSNLLRRITREDDRDRRLATVKQLKEFIQQPENKLVSTVYFKMLIMSWFHNETMLCGIVYKKSYFWDRKMEFLILLYYNDLERNVLNILSTSVHCWVQVGIISSEVLFILNVYFHQLERQRERDWERSICCLTASSACSS